MKGKRTDTEFVSNFISECVSKGANTPDLILKSAKEILANIDEEIRKAEESKKYRSKILDVIASFEETKKTSKIEEVRALSYFNMEHPQICYHICLSLKKGPLMKEDFGDKYPSSNLVYCIKQLLEHKVISKTGKYFLRGDNFADYLQTVYKEDYV